MPPMTTDLDFPAPEHLSPEAKALWSELVPGRARSPERRALMRVALESYDELQRIRAELKNTSLVSTTKTTGVQRLNPLLKFEKEARREFCRIWDALSLNFNCALDRHPNRSSGF